MIGCYLGVWLVQTRDGRRKRERKEGRGSRERNRGIGKEQREGRKKMGGEGGSGR